MKEDDTGGSVTRQLRLSLLSVCSFSPKGKYYHNMCFSSLWGAELSHLQVSWVYEKIHRLLEKRIRVKKYSILL